MPAKKPVQSTSTVSAEVSHRGDTVAPAAAVAVLKDLASGTLGGLAQVVAGHPFDTVKTKLQVQTAQNAKYTGMIHCFRKVMAEEGFTGLYRGALSPIAGAMAHNANVFFSYSLAKKVVGSIHHRDHTDLTIAQLFAAGSMAGAVISVVETPVDLFKIKLQRQGLHGPYTGSFDCARQVFNAHGVRGCYQGMGATIIRNIPAFGAYFGCFEYMRRALTPPGEKPTLWASFVGGSAAGLGFWASVYPLELIKSRMQADASDKAQRQYRSFMHCLRTTLAQEGVRGTFKGFVPCVTRAVPVNGAIFLAVSWAKSLISDEGI